MHRDGAFVYDDEERRYVRLAACQKYLVGSIFTVMAYLNADYEGGKTMFQEDESRSIEVLGELGTVLVCLPIS